MIRTIDIQDLGQFFINNRLNANEVILGYNITNAIIEMEFRRQFETPIIFKFSTLNNTIVITDVNTGTFIRTLKDLDFPPGIYLGDCTIKYSETDEVLTLYRMKIEILDSYTKLT